MPGTVAPLPSDERRLLKLVRNHAELKRTMVELALTNDLPTLDHKIESVAKAWFGLAREHLADAKAAQGAGRVRATYSRAYYAAYNASKSVRYLVNGTVSLKGDDHQDAPKLPDDFPSVARWSAMIAELYEHRLRADYDNWSLTQTENTLPPGDCVALAESFLGASETYILSKIGVAL